MDLLLFRYFCVFKNKVKHLSHSNAYTLEKKWTMMESRIKNKQHKNHITFIFLKTNTMQTNARLELFAHNNTTQYWHSQRSLTHSFSCRSTMLQTWAKEDMAFSSEMHFSALNNIMQANTWISDGNQMEKTTKILSFSPSSSGLPTNHGKWIVSMNVSGNESR